MSFFGRTLWLLPLALHIGYAAAVFTHFPAAVGRTADAPGTSLVRFYLMWFLVVIAANLSFILLHRRLPGLSDAMLSVPKKQFWLATPENRTTLVERLRALIETALFGLNLFFIAVFQAIYQANVLTPVIRLPLPVLVVGFMLGPLVGVALYFAVVVYGLSKLKGAEPPEPS